MTPKTLSLMARPDILYPDLEAMDAGVKRFIGFRHVMVQPEGGKVKGIAQYGFEWMNQPVQKPYRAEYAQALVQHDLIPGDDETEAFYRKLTD